MLVVVVDDLLDKPNVSRRCNAILLLESNETIKQVLVMNE
jgi:hypothetical protein